MFVGMPSTPLDPTFACKSVASFGGWMSKLRPISPQPSSKPKPREESSTDSLSVERLRLERLAPTWGRGNPKPLSTHLTTSPPRSRRGLCIDIENKPGTYGPGDYTHPKVTAVGWGWTDHVKGLKPSVEARTFDRYDLEGMRAVALEFAEAWTEADFIIAHNGRRHDRKILDGWYMTLNLPYLPVRRMVDTYLDMPKSAGLSKSLENLSARWACPIKKPHLEEHVWEAAYDGQPWALAVMRRRVGADVMINLWLWRELYERGYL